MRVLHVINSLGAGGAEQSLAELLPGLSAGGVESAVACLVRQPEGVHESVEAQGVPVTVIGCSRVAAPARIARLISQWRADVVHTTIFDADVLGRLAAVGRPCKVLTSLVNTYDGVRRADGSISPRKRAAARAVNGFTARHMTDQFHAISAAVRDSAVDYLGIRAEQVTVVERGRDLGRLGQPSAARRESVRRSLRLGPEVELVLNIGRQEPQKAHLDLIDAVVSLGRARPNLMLLQAGRVGKCSEELRRAARASGMEERIRFLGHRQDVGDLLAAADVFAFPSVYEGLGGSLLEAMAMRVPSVVTDVPALVDVVEGGRGAKVVRIQDPKALAVAIGEVLDDPAEASRLATTGRAIFESRFTLERSVEGMLALYRNLAESDAG